MSGLYGTLACRGDDGLSYGSVEPAPDLSAWRARRFLSAPWIVPLQPPAPADDRLFGTLAEAAAWLRDVPLPPHPRDVLPGAEVLPEGAVVLPIGEIAHCRIVHLLLYPSSELLLGDPSAIVVPRLSPAQRPGALFHRGRVRLVWHMPSGRRAFRVGYPTDASGWLWRDAADAPRLSVLLARHLHGLALDDDGQTAHRRIHIASMAAEIDALLRTTPWPEGAERALPIPFPRI